MNWRRAALAVAAGLPLVALLAFGLTRNPNAIPTSMPGQDAPDFALPMLEAGDSVRLASHAGDVVVLNFWASWCVPCQLEHPVLLEAARRYEGTDVHFYGIVYQDTEDNAVRWLERMGRGYPSLMDAGSRTAVDYALTGVPETYVVDRAGRVVFHRALPITDLDELLDVIEAARGGVPAAGPES